MTDYEGKVAVITGGANGMGAAVVRTLAAKGVSVVIADKDKERSEAVAAEVGGAGGDVLSLPMDVSDEEQVQQLIATVIERYGKIDFLDNNAAAIDLTSQDPRLTELSTEILRATLDVNLLGPFFLCKYTIPHMVANGGGSIVNMASITGLAGEPSLTAYGISKRAVMQLTVAVAAQYGKEGVRCNAIAPGLVQTPNVLANASDLIPIYERHSMTSFVGVPQDLANLVAFLLSDESRYITGQLIRADGGLTVANPILADLRS
jgi:NAD(P)-dependent dehydrogenase (short-subunit alcohol dehydrogenase family)